MATQARVTSTGALEAFRAHLILFMHKAHRSLDDVSDEVRQTRQWIQHDQRMRWEGEHRRRLKILDQAQQELMSVKLTGQHDTSVMVRQAAVNKARRAVAEAEDKLRAVKGWAQHFDSAADPLVKRMESMRQLLNTDLPKAISYLLSAEKTLAAYASGPGPAPATGSSPAKAPGEETQQEENS